MEPLPFILIMGALAIIAWNIWRGYVGEDAMICTDCGTIGEGRSEVKGNILIEIILWLCFIIPGLIYSIWRSSSRTRVCSKCGGKLIQLDTPRGQQLLKQYSQD